MRKNKTRITFTIPPEIAHLARRQAAASKLTLSAYILRQVEKDITPASENVRAEAIAAVDEIGPEKALRLLVKVARNKK